MNEKCSLDNLSRYLRVIGLLSLIIILIIVVYYYLQSNRSKILEKYESYALRECKVYFTEGDTNIKNCDITQETSNYTGTCSYRFDGWNEFDTYTDNDGKTITYPKKVYTQTRTNTNDFNNPMFTNNCFKAYTDETCLSNTPNDNCIPPEFEYNANNVVRYDEPGTSGNTAVGTNIYGGLRYSSMQFLNTADARYNNTNLISSICDVAPNDALGSLKDKVFYMFEFNGTTNKLENIRSVALDSNQTTFSPVSSDNVLTNLPPRPTDASFYGIQYDATNRNFPIKLFKKNNIPRNVAVFKFNYMSYICTNSQIKNYMRANRIIIPEKFIKYGSSTTPNYSKNISIGNMTINKDWKWSDYSSADFNIDYSDKLKEDLKTSIRGRREEIDLLFEGENKTALKNYEDANIAYGIANTNKTSFSTNYPYLYNKEDFDKSLIGIQKQNSTIKIFDYKSGYSTSSVDNFNISIPTGATAIKIGSDVCIIFPYTTETGGVGSGQTLYTITLPSGGVVCDVLIVGGGGGGGAGGGGGGGGGVLFATNITLTSGSIRVGRGGNGDTTAGDSTIGANGSNSSITINGTEYIAKGGGGGGVRNDTTGINRAANVENQALIGISGAAGGSGGGGGPTHNAAYLGYGGASNKNTYSNFQSFGNAGGQGKPDANPPQPQLSSGGGGGAGGSGNNYSASSGGGNGGAGKSFETYFGTGVGHNGWFAGGGGGNSFYGSSFRAYGNGGNGLFGGGGNGGTDGDTTFFPVNGMANTGGGGGGGLFFGNPVSGANGGSGVVIIRYKIKRSITNNTFGTFIDYIPPTDEQITTNITLGKSKFQANILSSFIFLQRGTYKFRAGIEGQNMILYSELIIYDENNILLYNYGDNKVAYDIEIKNGKFYKLAFRYIYCNFTNVDIINLSFKIYCEKQKLDLTNYLFGGAKINSNYINSTIMNLFSDVKYEGNSNADYTSIISFLDNPEGIDFFNIKKFFDEVISTRKYKNETLPARIEDTKKKDAAIINMQGIIGNIDILKSNRVNVNYSSHLPTTSPSIYKDITIDEIFGKNFDRLITKDKVKDYNALFNANLNTRAPPTKKIYVEAVAT